MTFTTDKPILVTGVTGYVAAWVALKLLEKGYKVRGTSRSKEKFEGLCKGQQVFSKAAADGRFTNALIEDVAKSDFTQAMKDVEVVIHTASPYHMKGKNAETYIKPALEGTLNVIKAAHKAGTVKKFVITSSFAAVLDFNDYKPLSGRTYTEKDWNSATVESSKDKTDPGYNYCASKKLAEEAAWNYQKENNLEKSMQIVALNPPTVFGPWVHQVKELDQLNETCGKIYELVAGKTDGKIPPNAFPSTADVRDLAEAHIRGFELDISGRYLISSGSVDNDWIAYYAQEHFPNYYKGPKISKEEGLKEKTFMTLDTSKAKKELGMTFTDREKTFHDLIEQIANFK